MSSVPKSVTECRQDITTLDKKSVQSFMARFQNFLKEQPKLNIRQESIQIQLFTKVLNGRGDELFIAPYGEELQHFKMEKHKLSKSERSKILLGTNGEESPNESATARKKRRTIISPSSNEIVAVEIKHFSSKGTNPPPETYKIGSDDENEPGPSRRDPEKVTIKQEPDDYAPRTKKKKTR